MCSPSQSNRCYGSPTSPPLDIASEHPGAVTWGLVKEQLNDPSQNSPTFSELLFKIRNYEKESQLKEMRKQGHTTGSSTKVHTKIHLTTNESEPSSNKVQAVCDAHTREQLEERIRLLEAELKKSVPTQNLPRYDGAGRKFSPKAKGSTTAPPLQAVPTENLTRAGRFCYNCGEVTYDGAMHKPN